MAARASELKPDVLGALVAPESVDALASVDVLALPLVAAAVSLAMVATALATSAPLVDEESADC